MTQDQLAHTILPLGSMRKTETRKIAEEHGFINARKADSQDICFVPDGDYASFLRRYTGKEYPRGAFLDKEGNLLGAHKGIVSYTIGQRKGLGISGNSPLYVCQMNLKNNTVTLGTNDELFSSELTADHLNLISCDNLEVPMRVKGRIRYRQKEQDATVTQIDDDKIKVVFDEPQRAITPGQAVVLYDNDTVVGGAIISSK